jgi:hypothetical protein
MKWIEKPEPKRVGSYRIFLKGGDPPQECGWGLQNGQPAQTASSAASPLEVPPFSQGLLLYKWLAPVFRFSGLTRAYRVDGSSGASAATLNPRLWPLSCGRWV